jgi:hypothetical protein
MNPQSFDPQQIGRYTVIRVHYEYRDQPAGEKLFVVLRHDMQNGKAFCWCIKATSQVQRFTEEMLNGCIRYNANEVPFFDKDTIIDTSNVLTLLHETINKEAGLGRYSIEGKLPDDFHEKFISVVRASTNLEPKKKNKLLEAVGESLIPKGPTKSSIDQT